MIRRTLLSLTLAGGLAAGPALAQGCDTTVQVANTSGVQVDQLFFSPSNQNDWGPDRLGQNVLGSGQTVSYRPNVGGAFDFKVVWSGGRQSEIRGVDICVISRVNVTSRGLTAE